MINNMKEQFQKESHSILHEDHAATWHNVHIHGVCFPSSKQRLISYLQIKADILIDELICLEY